jgi:hypothetical protein
MSDLMNLLYEEIRRQHPNAIIGNLGRRDGMEVDIDVGRIRVHWWFNDPLKVSLWDRNEYDKPVARLDMHEPNSVQELLNILAKYV